MTLNLTVPSHLHTDFTPRITVIGVGGGGCNAVNNMIASNLVGVEFVVANTDAQQLAISKADRRVQLGHHLTQGLGAGAKPEMGRAAAEEAGDELLRHLEGIHMLFVTAGMGGGTGTGAAPVIARMARERGILTVGVVTKPFTFEGKRRAAAAEQGIAELQQYVDTLIVIPNQNLFRMANERTSWRDAFKMADNVLYMGVRGVTDLMMSPGDINLDFADIRTVMAEMGKAMMGTGEAEGENRAIRAAEAAINNPLLEDTSMAGARGLLINITGGDDMTLFEVDQAANRIREEVADDANIIFGSASDDTLNGHMRVSVVATGIDMQSQLDAGRPRLVASGGGAPQLLPQAGSGSGGSVVAGPGAATLAGATPISVGLTPSVPSAVPAPPPVVLAPRPAASAAVQAEAAPPAPAPVRASYTPPPPVLRPAATPRPSAIFSEPSAPASLAPQPAMAAQVPPMSPGRSLFGKVTRGMWRTGAPEPAAPAEPQRAEPTFPAAGQAAPAPASSPTADETLEIPAFLRRQSSN